MVLRVFSFAEYNGWGLGGCFWFGELMLSLRLARGAYLGMFGGNFWYRVKFRGMLSPRILWGIC